MYIVHIKEKEEYHVRKELSQCAELLGVHRSTLIRGLEDSSIMDRAKYRVIEPTSYKTKSNRGGYREGSVHNFSKIY